ncbi:hypothetical protein FRC09_013428 [Ceratobasidium sp. 395]|nr:hypothetical protein FRC09_013428 [Ceratobasidium sp. 395]
MPREVSVDPWLEGRIASLRDGPARHDSDGNPSPLKRAYGNKYRSEVLVISDSDSDSDLPAPSLLLNSIKRKPPASRPNFKQPAAQNDIIDISSDSGEDATPTRPRVNKPPTEKRNLGSTTLPAVRPACSVSDSLSTTLERITFVDSPVLVPKLPSSKGDIITLRDDEPNSSDVSDSDNIDIFDEDSHHPGLIKFDIGPRRPKLITSGSSTSVSTLPTPVSSQSCGNDDPFNDVQTHDADEPITKTGSAKAGSSGSGTRSRVRSQTDSSTTPETPQLKPKGKARAAALTASSTPVSISPKPTPRNRAKILEAHAIALFSELNQSVFDDRLPRDCAIVWSKKLNTTAGRAHWKRIRDPEGKVCGHETYIELSTKVVDCPERINNTLSHEMCHLAAWIVDGEVKHQHGPRFKAWGNRVMDTRSDITITTCHSYEIAYKYEWKCASERCGQTFGRHSKSIDPDKQDYLKNHMKTFKAANPGMQHGEAMKRLGEMFRAEKEAMVDDELDQVMAGMTKLKLITTIN